MFCKKGVLENFAKFTRKHLCQSMLFNKIAGLKKRPWNKCFPVNFAKFLRTPLLRNTSGRPLLSYGCFLVFFLILRSGTEIYWDIVLLNICEGELPLRFPIMDATWLHIIFLHHPYTFQLTCVTPLSNIAISRWHLRNSLFLKHFEVRLHDFLYFGLYMLQRLNDAPDSIWF